MTGRLQYGRQCSEFGMNDKRQGWKWLFLFLWDNRSSILKWLYRINRLIFSYW